jgi:hypothetical protein
MFEVCMFVSTMPKLVRSELWHLFRLWRREVVEIRFWRAKRAFYRSHAQWRGICFRRWALRTLLRSYLLGCSYGSEVFADLNMFFVWPTTCNSTESQKLKPNMVASILDS